MDWNSDKADIINIHGSFMVPWRMAAAAIGSQQLAKADTLLFVDAV